MGRADGGDPGAAREWFLEGHARLGPPGLDDGAPAGFMVCDRDPATDLHVVDHPAHVVPGGRLGSPAQLILDGLTATPEWVICAQQNALKAQLSPVHSRRYGTERGYAPVTLRDLTASPLDDPRS